MILLMKTTMTRNFTCDSICRQATPWQGECYLCNWLLFIFPVLPSGDSEKKKKKKKKIKEEPDSDWWCHNDIMWSTILSCVHLVEFYRLVRMLKEEREREVENVPVVFRVIYVNSLLRIICYMLLPVNRLIGFIYPIMLVVFIYMTVWGVERSCFLKKKDKSSSKKLQALWKHLPGIFISWLFPFVLWYNKNIDI